MCRVGVCEPEPVLSSYVLSPHILLLLKCFSSHKQGSISFLSDQVDLYAADCCGAIVINNNVVNHTFLSITYICNVFCDVFIFVLLLELRTFQ